MISVITINYNNRVGLARTMTSVLDQKVADYEYIVVDGGSDDGSKELIESHADRLAAWVSESDTGIYNAMNKGIALSKGGYLLFLNSGDALADENILANIEQELVDKDIYYGDLLLDFDDQKEVDIYPNRLTFSFLYNKSLPHPASFIKRDLFDRVFYYNEKRRLVSDWEFFMCAICKHHATYKHLGVTISEFDPSGLSSSPENNKLMATERLSVMKDHFSAFIDDINELNASRALLHTNRFKILAALEDSKVARKINSFVLRILLKLFKNKTVQQLNKQDHSQ
ncbi:glycosyltransferase family 2 protein [Sungkyunkwania multivorans]|uniref:Glycosyltransferase family 2 protein n=1 Tax=Sungkyunkwania multivorans TaxID=1173618 RepID=A0ABW3D3G3_9FLAO